MVTQQFHRKLMLQCFAEKLLYSNNIPICEYYRHYQNGFTTTKPEVCPNDGLHPSGVAYSRNLSRTYLTQSKIRL
jgi:hypothetical protein